MITRVVKVCAALLCVGIVVAAVRIGTFEPKHATSFQTESAMWMQECALRCPTGTKPFILQGGATEDNHEDWRCGCMRK